MPADELNDRAWQILQLCIIANASAATFYRFLKEEWTVESVHRALLAGSVVCDSRDPGEEAPGEEALQ